jgi:hypothetical protein
MRICSFIGKILAFAILRPSYRTLQFVWLDGNEYKSLEAHLLLGANRHHNWKMFRVWNGGPARPEYAPSDRREELRVTSTANVAVVAVCNLSTAYELESNGFPIRDIYLHSGETAAVADLPESAVRDASHAVRGIEGWFTSLSRNDVDGEAQSDYEDAFKVATRYSRRTRRKRRGSGQLTF